MRTLVAAALIAVSASAPALAHEVRSVSWFVAHPDAVRVVRQMCRDNPGQGGIRNANCINSEKAAEVLSGDNWMRIFGQSPGSDR